MSLAYDYLEIFNGLGSSDPLTLKHYEEMYLRIEKEDPLGLLYNSMSIISQTQDSRLMLIALMYSYRIVNRFIPPEMEFPEPIEALIKEVMIVQIQKNGFDDRIVNYSFLIVNMLIYKFAVKKEWPEIHEVMHGLINSSKESYAISFFAAFYQNFVDEFPEEALQTLMNYFFVNTSSDATKLSQIHLYIVLLQVNIDFIELLPVCMDKLQSMKTNLLEAFSKFLDFFQYIEDDFPEEIFVIIQSLLSVSVSSHHSEGTRIGVIEILDEMCKISKHVVDFLTVSSSEFYDTMLFVFSNPEDNENPGSTSCFYETFISLASTLFSNNDRFKEGLSQRFEEILNSGSINIISSVLRFYCPVNQIDLVLDLIRSNNSIVIQNAMEGLQMLINENLLEITNDNDNQYIAIGEGLINLATERIPKSTGVLASFCEKCPDRIVIAMSNEIMGLLQNDFEPEILKCSAKLADYCPNEFKDMSVSILEYVLSILSNQTFKDDVDNIIQSASSFFAVLSEDNQISIIESLIKLCEIYPEMYLLSGFQKMAKQMQSRFVPFLSFVLPSVLDSANQRADIGYDTQSNWSELHDFQAFFLPNLNCKLVFRNEQFNEIEKSLKALSSYIETVGDSIIEHIEKIQSIVEHRLFFIFDDVIRLDAFSLLLTIIKAFPTTGVSFMPLFEAFYLSDEHGEKMPEVIEKSIYQLSECVKSQSVLNEFKVEILKIVPEFVSRHLNALNSIISKNAFSDKVDQEYVDIFWSLLNLMKSLEGCLGELSSDVFIRVYDSFSDKPAPEFIQSNSRIIAALIADFLEMVPSFEKFETFMMLLLGNVDEDDCYLRRIALYGIGHIISKKNCLIEEQEYYLDYLQEIISSEDSRNEEFAEGTDCAISSYAHILRKRIQKPGYERYFPFLLDLLPVYNDMDESKVVYEFIIDSATQSGMFSSIQEEMIAKFIEAYQDERLHQMIKQLIHEKKGSFPSSLITKINSL